MNHDVLYLLYVFAASSRSARVSSVWSPNITVSLVDDGSDSLLNADFNGSSFSSQSLRFLE